MRYDQLLGPLGLFRPASSGGFEMIYDLTVQGAEQVFPFLVELMTVTQTLKMVVTPTTEYDQSTEAVNAAQALGQLFNHYGSDKAEPHAYHHVYGAVLKRPQEVKYVLEVGLGTNNEDVASNMTSNGKPGASVRSFRDFLPNAQIFGADIDSRILFEEPRLKTYCVDQTKPETFVQLGQTIGDDVVFDLIIDDGLHSPNANLATMNFALPKLKVGGYFVVEDIFNHQLPFWNVVDTLLPKEKYKCTLIWAPQGYMYLVQRLR